jgi:hypothetical protein
LLLEEFIKGCDEYNERISAGRESSVRQSDTDERNVDKLEPGTIASAMTNLKLN